MIKIIVDSEKEKQKLIKESKYIHDLKNIDTDKCSTLTHIYLVSEIIEIKIKSFKDIIGNKDI